LTNYITPAGAKKLQEELAHLRSKARPKIVHEVADAAAQGDRSENAEYIYGKKKLREIDRRIHWLTKRLESAQLVDPKDRPEGERERVFFGATVEVEDEDGGPRVPIVGEDEIDTRAGTSATTRSRASSRRRRAIRLFKPAEIELMILSVSY
jgi:transcription elongation factor GreB